MLEYILSKYCSYVDDDVENIKSNISDNDFLKAHVLFLENRYKRYYIAHKIRGYIVKFIPILILLLVMLFPSKRSYVWYIPAACVLILISEYIIGRVFPTKYFSKIHGNITIIKGIIRYNNEKKLNI